jgi:uncharacterized protein DUF1554
LTVAHRLTLSTFVLAVAACGGSSQDPANGTPGGTPAQVSKGLKIFVTAQTHAPDFKDDPTLSGATAIEKADAFCNADPRRPDASTYKALLVDGVTRDAKSRTDWVLQPSTTYYRAFNDVPIGTTTSAAIFASLFTPLTNSIAPAPGTQVWTGIGSPTDYAVAGDTCNGWADATNSHNSAYGFSAATDETAFASQGGVGCSFFKFPVYCVQQP